MLCPKISFFLFKDGADLRMEYKFIGLTENEFKTRFNLDKSPFKLEHKRTSTTLNDLVWKLKHKSINFNIK